MSIREVMDFPNYDKIFRGGKMAKDKMVTWVCECVNELDIYTCELKTNDDGLKPSICPFHLNVDNVNWKKKQK